MSKFMKIRLEGAELFHASGWKDMTKLTIVAFRNFANAPKKANYKNIPYLICLELLRRDIFLVNGKQNT